MESIYDIAIVGGGPAGLTAALYGLRNGKKVITIEKSVFGGQIVNSPLVENIPGFISISGDEFGDMMLKQVQNQGGEVMFDNIVKVESDGDIATLYPEIEEPLKAKTVILATGTTHRRLGLPNEEMLIGNGIHFCAVCDGSFYRDKKVVLIGGGNSAFVEADHLVDIVGSLTILQDMPYFTADQKLQDKILAKDNIDKHVSTKILEYVIEDGKLKGIRYSEDGQEKIAECDGVFLAVGLVPENEPFKDVAELDSRGYFLADEYCKTMTRNIFVAGDCRTKSLRQVATACADGANAAIAACALLG